MTISFQKLRYKNLNNWSVSHLLANQFNYNEEFKLERIGNFLLRNKTQIIVDDFTVYKRVTIRLYNKGVKLRDTETGKKIGTKKQFIIKHGQFLMSKIDARNGAFGIATKEVDGAIITADFFAYDIDETKILPQFLVLLTTTKQFQRFAQSSSSGTTGRQRVDEKKFLDVKIPLPSIKKQTEILNKFNTRNEQSILSENKILEIEKKQENYFNEKLGIQGVNSSLLELMTFIRYKEIKSWSVKDLKEVQGLKSLHYRTIDLESNSELYKQLFRGKSPKYDKSSSALILNQKCNRWNKIELEYCKSVDENWLRNIDDIYFTKAGDILINSTGEGTIGRSTLITDSFINLLYDSHILLLRVNSKFINPMYLTYFINSKLGQDQINSIKSAIATKQTELGINNLKRMQFIFPPIDIQNELCTEMKRYSEEIENLQQLSSSAKLIAINEFESEIFN